VTKPAAGDPPADPPADETATDEAATDEAATDDPPADEAATDDPPADEAATDDPPADEAATDDEAPTDLEAEDQALEEAAEAVAFDLAALALERDEYLDQLRRLQAEFENYRKRVLKQQTEHLERAGEELVAELLPVLDAGDAALQHGDLAVEPIVKALLDVLEKQGLGRLVPDGAPFDPNLHDAVAHEPGEGESVVTEVLRPGYTWKGRVLRPAMVRVRG
jgi:molecular chaperone GrpE